MAIPARNLPDARFATALNMAHIKRRDLPWGGSHGCGPDLDYDAPHDRDSLSGGPLEALTPV